MELYDNIICEHPIPNSNPGAMDGVVFRTQDLGCDMDTYIITKSGQLLLRKTEQRIVPEEERPFFGKPEFEYGPLFRSVGALQTVCVGHEEIKYNGDLHFCAFVGGVSHGYVATFTDGQLQSIQPKDLVVSVSY